MSYAASGNLSLGSTYAIFSCCKSRLILCCKTEIILSLRSNQQRQFVLHEEAIRSGIRNEVVN